MEKRGQPKPSYRSNIAFSDNFKILNGTIEMIAYRTVQDLRLFAPPQPHSWMANFRTHPQFLSSIRKILSTKHNISSTNYFNRLEEFDYKSEIESITMNEFLQTVGETEEADRQDHPVSVPCTSTDVNNSRPLTSTDVDRISVRRTNRRPLPTICDKISDPKVLSTIIENRPFNYNDLKKVNDGFTLTSSFYGNVKVKRSLLSVWPTKVRHNEQIVERSQLFDVLIYAPPYSGKSTLLTRDEDLIILSKNFGPLRKVMDTDDIFSWHKKDSNVTITNMPHLIRMAKYSIAFVPSEDEFIRRCKFRGLKVLKDWYSGMLRETGEADVKILTDDFIGDALKWLRRKSDLLTVKCS